MPANNTTYKIFIASPSDCAPERELAQVFIESFINKDQYFKDKNISFEVVRWEDVPSAADRPQSIINNYVDTIGVDISIFFFWHRFGSDAGLGMTGTQEEFNKALNNLDNPRKLCFLRKTANPPMDDLNGVQFENLKSFLRSIQDRIFYKGFASDEKFKEEIKSFLVEFAKKVHLKGNP